MKEELLDRLHDNIIFNGRFCHSPVVYALSGKRNGYGELRKVEVVIKSEGAASLVRCASGTDDHIATGIAIGIELGKPTFGQIGEDFLKQKLPNYSNSGLGVALTSYMLEGIYTDRAKQIIQGVKRILDGEIPQTNEERAACLAIELFDAANKLEKDGGAMYSWLLYCVMQSTRTGGIVMFDKTEDYNELVNLPPEKETVCYTNENAIELEAAYLYYATDLSRVPEDFVRALTGYSETEIAAYYVMSLSENALRSK